MPTAIPTPPPARSPAAALAHDYLDAAPESAMTVEDYEWQMRPLGLGEMQATNLQPGNDIDPSRSGHDPVVVSFGDGERTPVQVWDGVHRILSSIMTSEGTRLAAVGVKKEGEVHLTDLPEDMDELISCLFEDADMPTPETLPTRAVRVDRFPSVALASGCDDRGVAHAADMAGQYLPPVVVHGDVWMDGRHRIHHLKEAGVEWMLAIDLAGLLPAPRPGDMMHIGVLEPHHPEIPMTKTHTPSTQVRISDSTLGFDLESSAKVQRDILEKRRLSLGALTFAPFEMEVPQDTQQLVVQRLKNRNPSAIDAHLGSIVIVDTPEKLEPLVARAVQKKADALDAIAKLMASKTRNGL